MAPADRAASVDTNDPLVSIDDLAREWQVTSATVAPLVASGRMLSLDGGRIVREGRLDVPCVRRSWAEALRVDSPGAARRIDLSFTDRVHPAFAVAYQFYNAVVDGDADVVLSLSSTESRSLGPQALLVAWREHLGDALDDGVSITSGVYRLDPYPAVGVRLIREAPPIAVVVDKATPVWPAGLIPLKEEADGWRADLETARLDVDWTQLTQTPLPD
jgi:hypothetical protein